LIFDPKAQISTGKIALYALLPPGLLCIVLVVNKVETLICVAILAPIFAFLSTAGLWMLRKSIDKNTTAQNSTSLKVSLLFLPVLAVPFFEQIHFPQVLKTVTTEFVIDAPAEVVWDNTFEIAQIQDDERVWTLSHNVLRSPMPIDAQVSGKVRDLRWTKGVRFQEHLTDVVEGQSMAWDFVFNAPETMRAFDPHIVPQGDLVNMRRGEYILSALPDGRTRLTLQTHYTLSTPINGYLGLWGELFLQDFHHAVLSVIKSRSEAQG